MVAWICNAPKQEYDAQRRSDNAATHSACQGLHSSFTVSKVLLCRNRVSTFLVRGMGSGEVCAVGNYERHIMLEFIACLADHWGSVTNNPVQNKCC